MSETMKKFEKFYQYTTDQFKNVEKKPGNIYLVREMVGDKPTGKAEIWFGTRKYADVGTEIGNISCGTF